MSNRKIWEGKIICHDYWDALSSRHFYSELYFGMLLATKHLNITAVWRIKTLK